MMRIGKSKYDAGCYFAGKLVGRCTAADSKAYVTLMAQHRNDAAQILGERAYLSPELKGVLERVVALQNGKNPSKSGLFVQPVKSPWGEVQTCDALCPGVFLVSTASHGGTLLSHEVSAMLSPSARKCGFKQGGYLCFEEDTQENVVLRELLDKKLWSIPERIKDKAAFEESINKSLREYNPDYWRARASGREVANRRTDRPARQSER